MHPVSYTNAYHDVTDLLNHVTVKNTKSLNTKHAKHNFSTK